ncbi:MAG: segregation/condensation protein A, partial [Methylococcales bacterium]|nr:segregation/condensation protein A [Methylococcales bacterium]
MSEAGAEAIEEPVAIIAGDPLLEVPKDLYIPPEA